MDIGKKPKTVVWKREGEQTHTLEVLHLQHTGEGLWVRSRISGILNEQPVLMEYQIALDKDWKVKKVEVFSLLDDDNRITLQSGRNEKWLDANQNEISELTGCIDIDLSLTPFTNTLPIKRLGNTLLRRTKITVLYINLDDWSFKKVEQYYTKLADYLYKYEGAFRNFVAEIPTDDFGLVTSYPGLFERLYPKS